MIGGAVALVYALVTLLVSLRMADRFDWSVGQTRLAWLTWLVAGMFVLLVVAAITVTRGVS